MTAIAGDGSGYLWFGTENGLNRYNGYELTRFYNIAEDSTSIPGNYITDIETDKEGNLWIGYLSDGVSRYDNVSNSFINYSLAEITNDTDSDLLIHAIEEDMKGTFWLSTNRGIIRLNLLIHDD